MSRAYVPPHKRYGFVCPPSARKNEEKGEHVGVFKTLLLLRPNLSSIHELRKFCTVETRLDPSTAQLLIDLSSGEGLHTENVIDFDSEVAKALKSAAGQCKEDDELSLDAASMDETGDSIPLCAGNSVIVRHSGTRFYLRQSPTRWDGWMSVISKTERVPTNQSSCHLQTILQDYASACEESFENGRPNERLLSASVCEKGYVRVYVERERHHEHILQTRVKEELLKLGGHRRVARFLPTPRNPGRILVLSKVMPSCLARLYQAALAKKIEQTRQNGSVLQLSYASAEFSGPFGSAAASSTVLIQDVDDPGKTFPAPKCLTRICLGTIERKCNQSVSV